MIGVVLLKPIDAPPRTLPPQVSGFNFSGLLHDRRDAVQRNPPAARLNTTTHFRLTTTDANQNNDDERPPFPPTNHHTTPRENHQSPIAYIKHAPHHKPLIGHSVATRYPNNPQRRQKNQPNTQKTRKNTPNKTPLDKGEGHTTSTPEEWCGGWDSNPRRTSPSGPEPDPFGHLGTPAREP